MPKLDRKKLKKDLEELEEEDRSLVREVLGELDGSDLPSFTPEEITALKDLLSKAKAKKGGGGVLAFLRGE